MIIHFWELPEKRNYIILKNEFKENFIKILEKGKYSQKFKDRIKNKKISIEKIKYISKKENIPLGIIEKNILWIGGNCSKGISNPKFPIDLKTKGAVRFIAAIVNDGTLTKEGEHSYGRLMYDNFDKSLRNSVLRDCLDTFGGKSKEIAFRNSEKKKYLEFPSVLRDTMALMLLKGPKAESNYSIPPFILKDKDLMSAWIEQTIADEGEVKHYPTMRYADKYRRAIVWRRSLDITDIFDKDIKKRIAFGKLTPKLQNLIAIKQFSLIEDEQKILNNLGISYKLYNLEIYPTARNRVRSRWQISITKRENLLKLRSIIKIPSKIKDEKFTTMTKGFIRYKEPIDILEKIRKLASTKKVFTSIDLKKIMNYKTTNTAIKWLNLFEKQGLIKKVKKSSYGNGSYRNPAEYKITLNK